MNLSAFEIDETKWLRRLPQEQAESRWRDGDGVYWIDVDGYEPAELKSWLEAFDLPPIIIQRCFKRGAPTQIIPLQKAAYLEVVVYCDETFSRSSSVGIICLKNLLITFHSETIPTFEDVCYQAQGLELRESTTSDLLVALLLLKTDGVASAELAARANVVSIDERLDQDADSVSIEEILDVKQAVSRLIAVSEEQEECFEVLAEIETDALDFSRLKGLMKLLTSISSSVNRRADRLVTQVSDLRARYEMNLQDRTNHRLAILTIISAVFLPLSLIAGIWGMNFAEMPELKIPYGYFYGLGFMTLMGAGLVWLFYWRGWFD